MEGDRNHSCLTPGLGKTCCSSEAPTSGALSHCPGQIQFQGSTKQGQAQVLVPGLPQEAESQGALLAACLPQDPPNQLSVHHTVSPRTHCEQLRENPGLIPGQVTEPGGVKCQAPRRLPCPWGQL